MPQCDAPIARGGVLAGDEPRPPNERGRIVRAGTRQGAQRETSRLVESTSSRSTVASRTPLQTEWNATAIEGDVAERVAELKRRPHSDLLKFGTGELGRTLLEHGLIDELHLWVFPVIAGAGQRLLESIDTTYLKLLKTTTLASGIVVHTYTPQG